MSEGLNTNAAAVILGVTCETVRRWDRANILRPAMRLPDGSRVYERATVEALKAERERIKREKTKRE